LSASTARSSFAEPCLRHAHRAGSRAICTAVAPDPVRTMHTQATSADYEFCSVR